MKKLVCIIIILWFCFPVMANAEEIQGETQDKIFAKFDFEEIDELLDNIFPNEKMDFQETILGLINGEIEFSFELLKKMVLNQFLYEFQSSRSSMIHILIIVIIGSVFHIFSGVFQNGQISELCFYVLYMLLITIILDSFRILVASVISGIENLLQFLQLLSPIYFMAVTIATGSVTSVAFYHVILFLVFLVETLILSIILPLVQVYMIVRILNDLSAEEFLSKLGELIQTIVSWSLKTLVAGVIGINMIQSMLTPAIDSVKRSILTRGGEAIPVVGDAIGGVAEVILGTAVLIKNGIGVAGTIVCIAICLSPVIRMAVIALMYKLTAALVQPISDKRMVGCISSMADGTTILLKIILASCILFLISIAMIAASTT